MGFATPAVNFTSNLILSSYRQMPGLPVAVCQGDTVIVDVHNGLAAATTTIHFHGEKISLAVA